ncbi:hypothetical protein [Streptomyces sp. NPDC018693]|uniref:hypothetical protein n=1 Tax=unclassified Streptomyces TaxID=2593676 RepID=UPI0037903E56
MTFMGTTGTRQLARVARLGTGGLAATLAAGLLAGCGPEDGAADAPSGAKSPTVSAAPSAPVSATPSAAPPSAAPTSAAPAPGTSAALACEQLRNAPLQTALVKLPDYPRDSMRLTDGHWEGGDGVQVDLVEPECATGQLVGDDAADAVGVVKVTPEGTGRFYTVVVWRNDHGTPVPAATKSLGDRNPVVSVTVRGPNVTVVYHTRHDTDPPVAHTLTRTSVYRVEGTGLREISRVDARYLGG